MAELKKNDLNKESVDLKSADSQKKDSSTAAYTSLVDTQHIKISSNANIVKNRKRTPVVADVIAGLLIILIAICVVVGTVYLFRYQSNDYGTVDVEYKLMAYCEKDVTYYRPMNNKPLYIDVEDNSVYFGKVTNIEFFTDSKGNDVLILTIDANVKYRQNDGYMINDYRLLVGSEYTVRSEEIVFDGAIIELKSSSTKGGK